MSQNGCRVKPKEHLLTIEPYRPGKPIDEVKRELGVKKVIKLASNENPYGPSPRVLKAIEREARNVNRYPDGGCFYLRAELAKRLRVNPDHLIFGNGSDEIIVMALRAFADEGDEVVIAKPSFLIYELASTILKITVRSVPLKNFYYDLEGMARAVTARTKMVFIGNPDNPAGTYVADKPLKDFLRGLRPDVVVLIDEAYYEYVVGKDYPDTLELLKSHSNLLITRTFSKMYGLAGLRVGYGIAHPAVVDVLNRIREPFNVNSLAQAAAVACLRDQTYYRRLARMVEPERQFVYRELTALGLTFVKSATNFILVDLKKSSTPVCRGLLKKGVVVRDMAFWGMGTFLRVTLGTKDENRKFIKSLRDVLSTSRTFQKV